MRVACYCRVSTKKDAQLDSLENQKQFFEDLVKQKKYELYEIYYDFGVSGKSLEHRDGLKKLLKDAEQRKFDAVFVKDISRLMRNAKEFLEIFEKLLDLNIELYFTNYGMSARYAEKTYLSILAVLAEDEGRRTSGRIKFGKDITAKLGRVPSFCYGYDHVDRYTLSINEQEAEVVKKMFDLYVNENFGTGKIAEYLNMHNIATKKQRGLWSQKTVTDILRNEIYTGWIVNKKYSIENYPNSKRKKLSEEEHVRVYNESLKIIDREVFDKAQAILEERRDAFKLMNKRESNKYAFSNLVKCADCNYSFRRCQRRYSENGKLYRWWVCSYRNAHGKGSCTNETRVDEEFLEQALIDYFNQIIADKDAFIDEITKELEKLVEANKTRVDEIKLAKDELLAEIKRAEEQRDILISLRLDNVIKTNEELEKRLRPFDQEIYKLKLKLAELAGKKSFISRDDIKKFVDKYLNVAESIVSTNVLDNAMLKTIIDCIKVYSDAKMTITFKVDEAAKIITEVPFEVYRNNNKTITPFTENST